MFAPAKEGQKLCPLLEKVIASTFWYAEVTLMVNYLQKGQTINGAYYSSLL